MKTVRLSRILDLCSQIESDEHIALILGCKASVVQKYRPLCKVKKEDIALKKLEELQQQTEEEDEYKDDEEYKRFMIDKKAMRKASNKLLMRHLETGQHWLHKQQFLNLIGSMGMIHRLPHKLREAVLAI